MITGLLSFNVWVLLCFGSFVSLLMGALFKWGRYWWPRGIFIFLQCSSFWWSRSCWPRGTRLFIAVLSLWWSRSFGPRGTNLFFTVGHPLTSGLWAFFGEFADVTLKICFCWSQKAVIPMLKSFQLQKFVEVSPGVCLVGQVLEERAPWSSPFKLAKMIPIWPQNSCISPGLAGNCDFVFPFEWPVPCPPRCSSKVGSSEKAFYYIGPSQ